MKRHYLILSFLIAFACTCTAKAQSANGKNKVTPVDIRDASNKPVALPEFGKKHLLIFYIDPDHASQNEEFREDLEEKGINSPNIHSFGVINLKDAPLMPNAVVRVMIRKKAKQTGSTIYTDPDHLLRDAWKLGDVNDKFTLIFVTKDREIAYLRKGELSPADIDEFYRVINKYR